MANNLISEVAKIAKYTVDPILHHAQYLCCFNNFAENFLNAKKELESTQEVVKERVNTAINRAETIVPTVNKWLKVVEKVLIEVQEPTRRISEINKSYFKRQCKYFLAKKIARETKNMIQLKRESNFKSFSIITEHTSMEYYSSKGFVLFKSTELTYNDLLEVLKDNNACMIGLVGMGGSGKTTLAKEVGKKVKEFNIFENVIIATVSKTPNIISIQAQIADKLGLKLEEESDERRAQRLSQRLTVETTLLILDDVWEKLDFEALGVPLNENNKGCRVLLTTQKIEVCTYMQCQSIIKLDILTNEEAWILFKLHAEIVDESSNPLTIKGKIIVDKCKGLPIAIVMVGSMLRGKTIEEWESALSKLKGLTSPYGCFQVSYDNLTDELAKSLFLMCLIFPENHEIDLEDLFRFGWGQGLFETFGTMEKARKEFHNSINILKDSFLLLHANKEKVKMHDMIRVVALQIAFERDQTILASNLTDSRMLVDDESIKDKRAIYIWDLKNGIVLTDDHLNSLSPSLEILVLQSLKVGLEESNASLERLKMLKILAFLTHSYHWYQIPSLFTLSLPYSLGSLENLHILCLRGYKLGNISILESLQALEILDLRGSSFEELPDKIVALKKLKLLDMYDCRITRNNAFKVIKGCLQLEELYLCPLFEEDIIPHEISFLSRLQRYVIQYYFARCSPLSYSSELYSLSRALCLKGFISLRIEDFISRVEYLHLVNIEEGYKNLIPSMDPKGMNKLNDLRIYDCGEIECLFDSNSVDLLQTKTVFTNLASLSMHSLCNLHKVFNDPDSRCSLQNLRELSLGSCPKLAVLFMSSIVQTLEQLEVLNINDCNELKHIIEEAKEGNIDYFPKLRSLDIRNCKELKYIFPVSFTRGLAKLEEVNIRDNHNLKYIFGSEREHHHQPHQITFLSLYRLHLHSLPNLIYLWPHYCSLSLPNLKVLECTKCPRLSDSSMCKAANFSELQQHTATMEKEIIPSPIVSTFNQLCDQMISLAVPKFECLELSYLGIEGFFQFQMEELGSNRETLNMDLRDFLLMNLLELNFIWKGPTNFLSLPKLQKIYVKGCPKLKTIFSLTIVKSFPGLIEMQISDCDELEQVFDIGDAQDHSTLQTPSQQVCFPNLDLVKVEKCNKLKCLFYNLVTGDFPRLRTLELKECFQLKMAFAFPSEVDDDEEETNKQSKQLQHLTTIRLTSLPNFKEIHHGFGAYVIKEIINETNFKEIINDCPIYSSRKQRISEALEKMSSFQALTKANELEMTLEEMKRRGALTQAEELEIKGMPEIKAFRHAKAKELEAKELEAFRQAKARELEAKELEAFRHAKAKELEAFRHAKAKELEAFRNAKAKELEAFRNAKAKAKELEDSRPPKIPSRTTTLFDRIQSPLREPAAPKSSAKELEDFRPPKIPTLAPKSGPWATLAPGSGPWDTVATTAPDSRLWDTVVTAAPGPRPWVTVAPGPWATLAPGSGPWATLAPGSGPWATLAPGSGPWDTVATTAPDSRLWDTVVTAAPGPRPWATTAPLPGPGPWATTAPLPGPWTTATPWGHESTDDFETMATPWGHESAKDFE